MFEFIVVFITCFMAFSGGAFALAILFKKIY